MLSGEGVGGGWESSAQKSMALDAIRGSVWAISVARPR
jgi:hypothetical protein